MTIREELAASLGTLLQELAIDPSLLKLEYPADPKHGDFATNIALVVGKKLGKNPRDVAEEIAKEVRSKKQEIRFIDKVEVAGPGFINFWLSNDYLLQKMSELTTDATLQALTETNKGKTVVVEYSSPNIAKPFTIGHLRSTIIGDAVARLLEATGWEVKRDNHVGDWGTQFGKQIYAIKTWGDEEQIEKAERPVKLLVELYVRFHEEAQKDPALEEKAREWFKKLEQGDTEARRLWEKCIAWSWKEFDQIYRDLGVSFTENGGKGYGESYFEEKMTDVVAELKQKSLLKEGDAGAQLVFFPDDTYPPLMILKKDGTTLYATRDLATDKFRLEIYGKDVTVINEVGAEQSLYFRQLYAVEEMLGWYEKGKRIHVKHGHFRFADQKMSTRKGNVIWLEDVLEEAEKRALLLDKGTKGTEETEGTIAWHVAIGALKWNDLKRTPEQDVVFDWDEMLTMQGNSGPYMQYTYARTQSVLRKSDKREEKSDTLLREVQLQSEEREIVRLLARYDEVVLDAAEKFAPNTLCNYLFDLAQAYNVFYQKCPILQAEGASKEFRLLLTQATGVVIKHGLSLLGIQTPERM